VTPATATTQQRRTDARIGHRGWRHQLPVYAPLSFDALTRAIRRASRPGTEPRHDLRALLAQDYQADDALLTDSGTHALQLAIRAGLRAAGASRIVALPAFTCYDVATAAVGADCSIALYDIDPDTLAPDPTSLEATLEDGARVIVISPLYGIPVDWDAIETLAGAHGALVIEDAAQGHGASWCGRPLGAHGRLSVLSFGRGKGWTGGAGGALLWRHLTPPSVGDLPANGHASTGRTLLAAAAQWALGRPALYHLPASLPWLGLGATHYHPPSPPREPGRAVAALALETRDAALREAGVRRQRAAAIMARLPRNVRTIRTPRDGVAGYLRLPVRVPGGQAPAIVRQLHRLGVAPSYPSALADLPAVGGRLAVRRPTPGADALVRELITLPTHSRLRDSELHALADGIERLIPD
jgi:perosamine synthetase